MKKSIFKRVPKPKLVKKIRLEDKKEDKPVTEMNPELQK